MSLAFVIEAFKFHRLKSSRIVQLLFVFVLIVNFTALAFPIGDRDFTNLANYLVGVTTQLTFAPVQSYLVPDARREAIISIGNIIFLLSRYLVVVINTAFAALYASAMNAGFDDYPNTDSLRNFFRKLPQFLLFALLLVVPYVFSLPLLRIPFYVLGAALAFTPLLMIDKNIDIREAMDLSTKETHGLKFQMVLAFLFMNFIVSLPRDFILAMVGGSTVSSALVVAFFMGIVVLSYGRLWSLFYLYRSRAYPSRRLHLGYHPDDLSDFFAEINRQVDEEKQDDEDDY